MPPEWMWHLNEELERHFDKVKERHRSGRDTDDGDEGFMIRNEYAKGRGREAAMRDG